MGQVAMSVLSLQEAAEQTGTSKLDIWRAIQEGALSAKKIDGGFAIDPAELSRVFASQQREQCPMESHVAALPQPQAPERPQASAIPESAAPTTDIAIAFAELQDQLKSLLGPLAEGRANEELSRDKDDQLDAIADNAATKTNPENDGAETPIPTPTSENIVDRSPKPPWWRRLV